MTRTIKLSSVVLSVVVAGAAFAQEADPNIDINGDGFYSYPELSTVYIELTEADFAAMDTNGDGLLDMAEVADAVDAGLFPE